MRRATLFLMAVLIPGEAAAHAAERGLIMLLPTGYYLIGGAAAVAVTFLALALARKSWISAYCAAEVQIPLTVPRVGRVVQWTACVAFLSLIFAGFAGSRDPLVNPLPLVIWTLWWVGFTALVAALGDLWRWLNPWSAPVRMLRPIAGPPVVLPEWVGYWPAVLSLLSFAWFEIVHIAPDDPARLARAAAVYWLAHLIAMVIYGEDTWRARGEAFSVFFAWIGRVGSSALAFPGLSLRLPGAALTGLPQLPLSGWLFAVAAIATVTFDGLSGTFWWLGLIGVNPLEFPGRSAVIAQNTIGLLATWIAMAAAFAGSVWLGGRLARSPVSPGTAIGRLALSLLPIALAYHIAHYLPVLLVNGQYALLATTDPLGTGADWLGLGPWQVTTSFLTDLQQVETIWQIQTGVIVVGHLLAVLVAHAIALNLDPDPRRALIAQVPLAGLMVLYTVLGLWLLSTPTGA
ncbi:MAG: hypothetical protein AAFV19_19875 [Pseudomonadota bacterium]